MADNNENLNEQANQQQNDGNQAQDDQKEFTYDELLEQLANERAEKARYKAAVSKTSSEAAEWKKKFRARQTAEEQEADAKREEAEQQKEHLKKVERELSMMKAKARYLKQGMDEKLATECAELETENDIDALMGKISQHTSALVEAAAKKAQEELLASRPDIKAGNGEDGGAEEEDPFIKAFNNPDAY